VELGFILEKELTGFGKDQDVGGGGAGGSKAASQFSGVSPWAGNGAIS
jgi:hypothetical protein